MEATNVLNKLYHRGSLSILKAEESNVWHLLQTHAQRQQQNACTISFRATCSKMLLKCIILQSFVILGCEQQWHACSWKQQMCSISSVICDFWAREKPKQAMGDICLKLIHSDKQQNACTLSCRANMQQNAFTTSFMQSNMQQIAFTYNLEIIHSSLHSTQISKTCAEIIFCISRLIPFCGPK